jgi:hypothetical protein
MMIDMTDIASAVIASVITILAAVIPVMIQSHMKDKQAAGVLSNAVVNALGAIKQAALDGKAPPMIPGVAPSLAAGVQYVTTHAGAEAARFDLSPELIADKIRAKQGLQALAVDVAAAAPPPVLNVSTPASAAIPVGTMPRPLFSPTGHPTP